VSGTGTTGMGLFSRLLISFQYSCEQRRLAPGAPVSGKALIEAAFPRWGVPSQPQDASG